MVEYVKNSLTTNKRIHPRWFEERIPGYHQLLPQIKSPHPTTSAFTPSPPPSKLLAKVAILNLDLIRAPQTPKHIFFKTNLNMFSKNPSQKKHGNYFWLLTPCKPFLRSPKSCNNSFPANSSTPTTKEAHPMEGLDLFTDIFPPMYQSRSSLFLLGWSSHL